MTDTRTRPSDAAACIRGRPHGIAGSLRLTGTAALVVALWSAACARAAVPVGIDGDAAYAVVVELAGARYAGRMVGSEGGALAREYLSERLEKAGYAVESVEFRERAAHGDGEAALEMLAGPGNSEGFAYRVDFRDIARGGYEGGAAEGPLFVLRSPREPFPRGSILLVPAAVYDAAAMDEWAEDGAAGLLLELPAGTPRQRALWAGQAPGALVAVKTGMPVLALSHEAFARIETKTTAVDSARIRMSSPIHFVDVAGVTLVAEWNGDGESFSPTVLIMAHYDHVGSDKDGSYFPGALDNASGVGIVVALAEAFARDKVKADIAVVLTDGEETGLSGAYAFAAAAPFSLAGVTVVNVDMAGSKSDTKYAVYSDGGTSSLPLSFEAAAALRKAGLRAEAEYPVYNVDHTPLAAVGASAVTICEYDTSRYHEQSDTPGFIDAAEMDAVGDALYGLVAAHARR